MAAADDAGSLPSWVMLESFVFRRDDPESFREDERTSASSVTSAGAPFRVSFILADPPTPSRLYVSWPDGPKSGVGVVCHLVAAHGGLVLLRLDSVVLDSTEKHPTPYKAVIHDYFVYYVPAGGGSDPRRPSLKRLPAYAEYSSIVDKPVLFPFETQSVGLCRRGEEGEEFALAYLGIRRTGKSASARLWVLRSTVAAGGRGDGDSSSAAAANGETEKWEIKNLPIGYQAEEFNELHYWLAHATVPFKNSLCWVNYYCGILLSDDVFGDKPKISYHRLPLEAVPRFPPSCEPRKELYRSLCVVVTGAGGDDHHRQLRFVDVARDDGEGISQMKPAAAGFTITSYLASRAEDSHSVMQWSADAVVKSSELWDGNTPARLPREVMMLPLLSMDKPDVAHLVLYRWQGHVDKVSLVAVDLKEKRVVGSIVEYIRGEEDLATDDADMVKLKSYWFDAFLPTEFPKFLNPKM